MTTPRCNSYTATAHRCNSYTATTTGRDPLQLLFFQNILYGGQNTMYGVVVTGPAVVPAGAGSSGDELWCVIDSSHCYLQPRQLHGMRCDIQTSPHILLILLQWHNLSFSGVEEGGGRGPVIKFCLILQISSVNSVHFIVNPYM